MKGACQAGVCVWVAAPVQPVGGFVRVVSAREPRACRPAVPDVCVPVLASPPRTIFSALLRQAHKRQSGGGFPSPSPSPQMPFAAAAAGLLLQYAAPPARPRAGWHGAAAVQRLGHAPPGSPQRRTALFVWSAAALPSEARGLSGGRAGQWARSAPRPRPAPRRAHAAGQRQQ